MFLDTVTIAFIFVLAVILAGLIGALINILTYKLDKYDQDDLKFQQWLNYRKNNPKKKG